RQAIFGVIRLPSEEVLGAESAVVHAICRPTSHSYDPLILDGDVECIPVGMQWRSRLGPAIYIIFGQLMFKVRIDSNRPLLPRCSESLSDAPQNHILLLLFIQQPTHKGNA